MVSLKIKRLLGFTLLEMMLVIALIGILASFAIPAYEDYLVKVRVSEGIALSATAKIAVNEFYMNFHELPNNIEALNYQAPEPTDNVSEISIGQNGVIAIHYTERAGHGSLLFTPTVKSSGQLGWCCNGGTLAVKYRPNICRC
jgi:type IV pilus assembly protein PilA